MFSSCNPKFFAERHIHYPVYPSSDNFHTVAVVPSSDQYCTETVAPSGDHYCFDHHHIVSAMALSHRTYPSFISAMSSMLGLSPKCVQLVMMWFRSHVAAPHIQFLLSR